MAHELHLAYPKLDLRSIPVADGGEGTVDAFLAACGGEKVHLRVRGPFKRDLMAFYGLLDQGQTAVIEMAACAGLPLVGKRLQPQLASTFGVGQLIADALQRGCERIIVGLGGSATNDLGAGCAAGLGMRFLDAHNRSFIPTGATLDQIATIDPSGLPQRLREVELITMCDIDNPLYGPNGAAYIFSPQKGADPALVLELDRQLQAGAQTIFDQLGMDISALPGAGAAGGMGGGMVAFLGAKLQMGIEVLLNLVNFDALLQDTAVVLTGEGRLDSQSLRGKVVIGVSRRAKRAGVPVGVLVGALGEGYAGAYDQGVSHIFNINQVDLPFEQAKKHAAQNLAASMPAVIDWLKPYLP